MTEEDVENVANLIDFDNIKDSVLKNSTEIVSIKCWSGDQTEQHVINISRQDVFLAASNGASLNIIANLFGIDRKTCFKYFKKEIEYAHGLARWKLQNKLYLQALTGQGAAERIFLAKNWLGMSDTGMSEDMMDVDDGVEFVVKSPIKKEVVIQEESPFIVEDRTGETT